MFDGGLEYYANIFDDGEVLCNRIERPAFWTLSWRYVRRVAEDHKHKEKAPKAYFRIFVGWNKRVC